MRIYVTRAAEYYYYTTVLFKPFSDKNVDLKKWTWTDLGGGSSNQFDPPLAMGL